MLLEHEIAETYPAPAGTAILTPSGWAAVETVYKTVPLNVWEIITAGHSLRCSGHHLVKVPGRLVRVEELEEGMHIDTDRGYERVVSCRDTGEEEELYDITISHCDGLFYSNGIISHNSTTFAARQLINASIIPNYDSLYVVPLPDHMKTYARRLQEMENAFRFRLGKQNLYNKILSNASKIDLLYCRTSAEKSRGKTVSEVCIDEAQHMDPDIIPELLYVQTTSDYPSTIYAGTALSVDTLLEYKWSESSRGAWMILAGDDKTWLDCSNPDTLKAICNNPEGPVCPVTGRMLDVRRGHYVHASIKALDAGDVGLHVPQIIIPDLVYNQVQWTKIYRKVKRDDWTKVLQECFGIAVDSGEREITVEDLKRLCVLKESKGAMLQKAREGYYRLIVSGCDWGGSDYNPAIKTKTSYTVHCIIGITPDWKIDILHFHRYAGMDYRTIAARIVADHKMWKAKCIATDFGVGMAYNMLIRDHLDFNTHFIMNYVGPSSAILAEPKGDHMANQLSLNRTEAITSLFHVIKQASPRIRCRSWEEMESFLMDFMAMYRVPSENSIGATMFKYHRSASKADDALHALVFAYTIAKFYLGEPIVADAALNKRMRQVIFGSPDGVGGNPSGMGDDQNWVVSG